MSCCGRFTRLKRPSMLLHTAVGPGTTTGDLGICNAEIYSPSEATREREREMKTGFTVKTINLRSIRRPCVTPLCNFCAASYKHIRALQSNTTRLLRLLMWRGRGGGVGVGCRQHGIVVSPNILLSADVVIVANDMRL